METFSKRENWHAEEIWREVEFYIQMHAREVVQSPLESTNSTVNRESICGIGLKLHVQRGLRWKSKLIESIKI